MKTWSEAVIEEINFTQTEQGGVPILPGDGSYTDGCPYGANS